MLLVEFEDVLQGPDNELKNIFRALLVLGQLQVLSQHCETLVNLLVIGVGFELLVVGDLKEEIGNRLYEFFNLLVGAIIFQVEEKLLHHV